MKSMNDGYLDILKLARELRGERLFIQSEIDQIQTLNDKLEKTTVELAQAVWTNTQQRFNVKQLVAQGDLSSSTCCQKTNCILSPLFVDALKVLKYQDTLVLSSVIQYIRSCPAVASLWLAAAEAEGPAAKSAVTRALCGGIHMCDITPLRDVLRYLAHYHLSHLEDPQRVISDGTSSFTHLYCELLDGFKPARMFLIAALREPILPLLQIDHCLIVNPDVLMERMKKSSQANLDNDNMQEQVHAYRNQVMAELVTVTERFINSLCNIWILFPPMISWIVQRTVLALKANKNLSDGEVFSICTNLVFTNFICRAIVNPEVYGVTDVDISNLNRLNLVQVSLILEKLCLLKYQEVNGKFRDLYSKFEKDCVYPLLDMLLESNPDPNELKFGNDMELLGRNGDESKNFKTDVTIDSNVALFTLNDLQLLVEMFKKISAVITSEIESPDVANNLNNLVDDNYSNNRTKNSDIDMAAEENQLPDADMACGVSYANNEHPCVPEIVNEEFCNLLKGLDAAEVAKFQKLLKRLPNSSLNRESLITQNGSVSKGKNVNTPVKNGAKNKSNAQQSREVLIIKLPTETYERIGMTPENKILECHYSNMVNCHNLAVDMLKHDVAPSNRSIESLDLPQSENNITIGTKSNNLAVIEAANSHNGQEKRTRFSLSHDEGSIGNTSDNLEVVSEAASNHSVTSSLEMETEDQNDNLSDMVSANVSGRGSPNISGRDTPSSQVTEGDMGASNSQPPRQSHIVHNSATITKQAKLLKRTRNDIEDKFCKFEIKKLMEGDETISIMSDTWSTDVLASDSETIGESVYEKNFMATNLILHQQSLISGQLFPSMIPPQPDASETASESAWSTDALIPENDRITEVDMEDSAPRSDTNGPQEKDDKPLNSNLPSFMNNSNKPSTAKCDDKARKPDGLHPSSSSDKLSAVDTDSSNGSINENGVSPLLQKLNKATSQWLNDPSQKFPVQNFDQTYDFPSCSNKSSNSVGDICKNMDGVTICNGDDFFKVFRVKKDSSSTSTNSESSKSHSRKSKHAADVKGKSIKNIQDKNSFIPIMDDNNEASNFNYCDLTASEPLSTKTDLVQLEYSKKAHSSSSLNKSCDIDGVDTVKFKKYVNIYGSDKEGESSTPVNDLAMDKDDLDNIPASGASGEFRDGANTLPRQSIPNASFAKPGPSTGAIPKSISFDSTAEKNYRYSGRRLLDDSSEAISINFGDFKNNMKKSGGNFLNKFKLFKNKNKGHVKIEGAETLQTINDAGSHDCGDDITKNSELSDDILAKYRRKPSSGSDAAASDSTSNSGSTRGRMQSNNQSNEDHGNSIDGDSAPNRYSDIEFSNLQIEILHVLSDVDIHNIELPPGLSGPKALECILRLISITDPRTISALEGFIALEPLRKPLMINGLMGKSATRHPYLLYLSKCRKSLLSTISGLENECAWHISEIQRQGSLAAALRTRSSLAARESRLMDLQEKLRSGLVDERRDTLFLALDNLTSEITAEEVWADATEWELEQAMLTIERVVISRVYTQIMFPNGEGDIMRDQLLRNHIAKLRDDSSRLTPRLRGTQWIHAQRILDDLHHHRTPRDKVNCIVRCVNYIVSLLSLSPANIPGADDLMPILIYIIIKANPPSLLSTIQFVDNFINPQLEGEHLYCWTQFSAAIKYIKTID